LGVGTTGARGSSSRSNSLFTCAREHFSVLSMDAIYGFSFRTTSLAADVGCDVGLASRVADRAGLGLLPPPLPGSYVYVVPRGRLFHGVDEGGSGRCRKTCIFGQLGDPGVLCPLSLLGDLRPSGDILGP